jgi:hypothetical protein
VKAISSLRSSLANFKASVPHGLRQERVPFLATQGDRKHLGTGPQSIRAGSSQHRLDLRRMPVQRNFAMIPSIASGTTVYVAGERSCLTLRLPKKHCRIASSFNSRRRPRLQAAAIGRA